MTKWPSFKISRFSCFINQIWLVKTTYTNKNHTKPITFQAKYELTLWPDTTCLDAMLSARDYDNIIDLIRAEHILIAQFLVHTNNAAPKCRHKPKPSVTYDDDRYLIRTQLIEHSVFHISTQLKSSDQSDWTYRSNGSYSSRLIIQYSESVYGRRRSFVCLNVWFLCYVCMSECVCVCVWDYDGCILIITLFWTDSISASDR